MGRTKIDECHLPEKKGGGVSSVVGGFLVCYAFVFRNVIKGYSRAKDEPGSNEKTMGEGGDAVTHLRLDLDHKEVLVYMYFFLTFSLLLITIESPARNPAFNYICFFS